VTRTELAAAAATRFNIAVEAITSERDLSDDEKQYLPEWWTQSIAMNCAESIQMTLQEWNRVLPGSMRRLRRVMADCCLDVQLVRMSSDEHIGIALQYTFDAPAGREYLFGYPPEQSDSPIIARLPQSVQDFYSSLHNGLHNEPVSEPVGIYKAEKLIDWESLLGDSELHYLSEPPKNPPQARNLILFYTDGAGGYILSNTDPNGAEAWTAAAGLFDDEPEGLWGVIDDWIALALTGDFIE
jgi:hypothetical protein